MKVIARVKANGVNKNMPITSIKELNLIRETFVEAQRVATLANWHSGARCDKRYWHASSVNAHGFAEGHAEGV